MTLKAVLVQQCALGTQLVVLPFGRVKLAKFPAKVKAGIRENTLQRG